MSALAKTRPTIAGQNEALKAQLHESIQRLANWLEKNDYRGYDTFDGLNAKFARPLTFETKLLRTVLQQGVRRFPDQPAAAIGSSQEPVDKGHGLPGPRFYAAAQSH